MQPLHFDFRVLIVDDDEDLAKLICDYLSQFNIRCDSLPNGDNLENQLAEVSYQLLILDLMLPGRDGITLCRSIRAHSNVPILMLTARSELADRVMALEIGADDYVQKPFDPRELVARIRTILRRSKSSIASLYEIDTTQYIPFSKWTLDKTSRELIDAKGMVVSLSNAEFRLLMTFLKRPRQILSREQLIEDARGRGADVFDRSIDLLVSRLRQKLEDDSRDFKLIRTVRGEGYLFDLRND